MGQQKTILSRAIAAGGATLDAHTLAPSTQTSGYCVSEKGGIVVAKKSPLLSLSLAMMRLVARMRKAYLGLWVDAGKVYMDVTHIIHDRSEAMRFAKANSQLAIFDLSTGSSVYTSKEE